MAPVPLELLLLLLRSITDQNRIFTLLVNRANELQNPDFIPKFQSGADANFIRFGQLFRSLHSQGILNLVKNSGEGAAFDFVISNYAPEYLTEVRELLVLLDLDDGSWEMKERIVIPVYFAVNPDKSWGIGITTRSTFDLVEILRASIQVPEEHSQRGLAINYPLSGHAGQELHIKSSVEKPSGRPLAVSYREHWFFIDETDQKTKEAFRMLRMLWANIIASSSHTPNVPVMTIPVSR